jgi:hypothetical protein
VNLLSLCRLAEQYSDENGNPDQNSTGINSDCDSHTLYWNKKKFCKTYYTANSGLLECLFTYGYTESTAFTRHLTQYYDDTVYWAISSKVKNIELSASDNGDIDVTVDSEGGISFDMPVLLDSILYERPKE